MRSARGRLARAAIVLVLTGGLSGAVTGCAATREAGAAALVGDDRIPVGRLQDLTNELVRAGGNLDPATQQPLPAGEAQRRLLEKLIISRLLARAAEDSRVSVTRGQVDARVRALATGFGGVEGLRSYLVSSGNVPPSYVDAYLADFVTGAVLAEKLLAGKPAATTEERQQALAGALTKASREMPVEVNPRYGRWNASQGIVTPLPSGGLASDAPTPSSSPSP